MKVFRYLEKKWKIACEQRSNSIGVLMESQLDRSIVWASKTTGFSSFQRELSQEIQRISVLSKLRQWNSCCSHAIFYFFSKYLKTFNHKIKRIQDGGSMLNVIVFYLCSGRQSVYYKYQYSKTYTLCGGLNHVNYLNIIKRNHVSVTVRTRLHLASGWSLDHSGA